MPWDSDIVKKQVIALLGLAVRNSSGVPTYSTALGDNTYADDEIDRAIADAENDIMTAICETDGHPERELFVYPFVLEHAEPIPKHFGSMGIPRITPFPGATYTIAGRKKSVEDILSYRANPNNYYSTTAHNEQDANDAHSKLAGFYAQQNGIFYFTGHEAESDMADFEAADKLNLPESRYPLATQLAIAHLKKDGDVSDIFAYNLNLGMAGLQGIRSMGADQPSVKTTIGKRDSGMT